MATNKDFVVKNGLQVGANTSIEGSITTVDSVQFDANAAITVGVGQLAWNADAGTLDLGISSDVTLQVGQETHVHVKAAEAIADGDVVYASGAVGNSGQIEVSKFIADGTIEERRVIGIATESAALGEFFYVTSFGAIRGVSTDGSALTTPETWSDGTILYASPDVAGELTSTLPVAPNPAIALAFVTSAHASNGILFVRAYDPGFHFGELHDVHISSVANNQILTYDAVNSRWSNSDDLNLPGSLTVAGDFTVSGNTTLVNTTNLSIEDLNIVVASGVANSSLAEGAGITIAPDSANVVLGYNATDDALDLNNTLMFSSGRDGYLTNTLPGIYRAFSTSGTYPFNRYGDLVIQARSSHARDIVFATGLTPANRMVINSDGNVGIGTDTPDHTLRVNGDTRLGNLHIKTSSFGAGGTGKTIYADGAGSGVLGFTSTTGFDFNDGSTSSLSIDANGILTTTANTTTLNATTVNATTLNGAFGNTAVTIASAYPVTPSTGNIWFDNLNLKLKVFDGSNWQDAVPSGGGGSANTQTTDANSTFSKYTYVLSSATSTVSGADVANNTLSYDTSGIENVEVFVNGVKQVEGASYDYAATTGTSIGFTTTLSAGDVVDVQVYELLTNDAFVLKAGGAFEGTVEFTNTAISQTFTNASLAHGMTLIADTDEFLRINREAAGGNGGVRLSALTDGSTAFNVSAYSTTPSTDGNNAVIRLRASKANGTSEQALAANEDVLTIGNTGTELFVLKGSGNLGLGGEAEPGARVEIKGAGTTGQQLLWLSNSNGIEKIKFGLENTGAGQFELLDGSNNSKIYFSGHDADNSYIDIGNLAIGHTSPSNALHIKAPNTSGRGQVTIEGDGDNVDPRMSFYGFANSAGQSTTTYVLDIFGDVSEQGARYDVPSGYYQAFTEQGTKRLRIAPGGNLLFERNGLIGRNTSDGSDNGYIAVVGGGAESDGRGAIARFYGNEHSTESGNLALSAGNTTGAVISLRAGGSTPAYIGAGGLGMGTDSPNSYGSGVPTIHFQGTASNGRAGAIRFHKNDGTQTGALYSTDGNDGYGGIILHAAQSKVKMAVGTLQDTKMSIDTTGYVAIGKGNTVANNRLEVVHTGTDATVRIENTSGQATEGACLILDASGRGTGVVDIDIFKIENNNGDLLGINNAGDLIPYTSTQDLGSTANPWQNIYTQDLVLSNEARATGNEVDGTKGNWTIQEGEDHLYIINNKNGKKYRFALEEIE